METASNWHSGSKWKGKELDDAKRDRKLSLKGPGA